MRQDSKRTICALLAGRRGEKKKKEEKEEREERGGKKCENEAIKCPVDIRVITRSSHSPCSPTAICIISSAFFFSILGSRKEERGVKYDVKRDVRGGIEGRGRKYFLRHGQPQGFARV